MKYRKALTIGVNYTGTPNALRGCVNDALDWTAFLRTHHFDVTMLTDQQATRVGILKGMTDLITSLRAEDIGLVTFSGHGTWVPDRNADEADGRDEAICPVDLGANGANLILDDEINELFGRLVPGATLIFLSDCCHSGTVFRFAILPEQEEEVALPRNRFLPPSHFIQDQSLFALMAREYTPIPVRRNVGTPLPRVIHLSACRDTEYAADAFINGRFNGAYTYYCLQALTDQLAAGGTYHNVWQQLRTKLPSRAFPQTPQLNATLALKKTKVFA